MFDDMPGRHRPSTRIECLHRVPTHTPRGCHVPGGYAVAHEPAGRAVLQPERGGGPGERLLGARRIPVGHDPHHPQRLRAAWHPEHRTHLGLQLPRRRRAKRDLVRGGRHPTGTEHHPGPRSRRPEIDAAQLDVGPSCCGDEERDGVGLAGHGRAWGEKVRRKRDRTRCARLERVVGNRQGPGAVLRVGSLGQRVTEPRPRDHGGCRAELAIELFEGGQMRGPGDHVRGGHHRHRDGQGGHDRNGANPLPAGLAQRQDGRHPPGPDAHDLAPDSPAESLRSDAALDPSDDKPVTQEPAPEEPVTDGALTTAPSRRNTTWSAHAA